MWAVLTSLALGADLVVDVTLVDQGPAGIPQRFADGGELASGRDRGVGALARGVDMDDLGCAGQAVGQEHEPTVVGQHR